METWSGSRCMQYRLPLPHIFTHALGEPWTASRTIQAIHLKQSRDVELGQKHPRDPCSGEKRSLRYMARNRPVILWSGAGVPCLPRAKVSIDRGRQARSGSCLRLAFHSIDLYGTCQITRSIKLVAFCGEEACQLGRLPMPV